MKLDGKNVIITGATSGIGKEAAIEIAKKNPCIVLPVRNLEKGEQVKKQIVAESGNPSIYLMECDLASFDSIRDFAGEFKKRFSRLHLLINNAGIWESKRSETRDGIEMTFGVNHLATFLLTNLLLDEIRGGTPARIINVTSEAHRYTGMNFDDPEGKKKFSSFKAYGQSKLANILFTRYLAEMLREDGVTVHCMHPGFVATHLFDKIAPFLCPVFGLFMKTPRQGAETAVYLASSPEVDGSTGGYYVNKKKKNPSRAALDDEAAKKLWELSSEYTGHLSFVKTVNKPGFSLLSPKGVNGSFR